MGTVASSISGYCSSIPQPNFREKPTFDPMYGFPNGREERVMKVTEEEMQAAGLKPELRDYCAHYLIDFFQCRRDNFPIVVNCKPIKHAWDHCQFEDYVLRMKEYEREHRLLARAHRKSQRRQKSEELLE